MNLTKKQKRYVKKHYKNESLENIAIHLEVSSKDLENYLNNHLGEQKFKKFIAKKELRNNNIFSLQPWSSWIKVNWPAILGLTLLVLIAYVNSLGNDFVSDDIDGIVKNENITKLPDFRNLIGLLRQLIFFVTANIFGKAPWAFRLINIFFHLGSVITAFTIVSLMINPEVAFMAGALMAVHPLQIEAVTWISGGPYVQYSFFILLALLFYILSFNKSKYYYASFIGFVLALLSSEKAMVFPIIIGSLLLSYGRMKREWKKLLIFLGVGMLTVVSFLIKIPQRLTSLQTDYYEKPKFVNPLFQLPIAIASYLKLLIFPNGLTLYHTEMAFNIFQFIIFLIVFLLLLVSISVFYKKNKIIFFWLSFFLISLIPMLTPFGISWMVAERYVYLGALGIYIVIAQVISKIAHLESYKKIVYLLFSIVIVVLSARTIIRNIDWRNEDNLWLSAAKTSPSSAQNHNNLGDYYSRHNDFIKAAQEFQKAININPNYGDAYHNLGNALQRMGNYNKALESYQKAISLNPNLWQSYQQIANIYFINKDFSKAEASLKEGIQVTPNNHILHYNLAYVYFLSNKFTEAKQQIQETLKIKPDYQQANLLLNQLP